MHLLKRFFCWLQQPVTSTELRDAAEHNNHRARDLGVNITRIRLPSGAEIVMVEHILEAETESRADLPRVEAQAFIHEQTGP